MDENDHARFEAVYRSTYDPLLGYAMRRCVNAEDAADVVAQTYLIAWRRVGELPDGDRARMWLYGVARKILANHHRGERRRTAWHAEFMAETERLHAVGIRPDELDAVDEAMNRLSEDDRELLTLAAWEGLSSGEIAKVLGCSGGAVRIRLHRARRRFAKALQQPDSQAVHAGQVRIRKETR